MWQTNLKEYRDLSANKPPFALQTLPFNKTSLDSLKHHNLDYYVGRKVGSAMNTEVSVIGHWSVWQLKPKPSKSMLKAYTSQRWLEKSCSL